MHKITAFKPNPSGNVIGSHWWSKSGGVAESAAAMVRDALCSHYEGTPDAVTPHPDKELEVAESSRAPICRSSTLESFVCTFTAKPEDTEFAIAVGRPCETPYASYRPLSGTLPTNAVTGDAALRRMAGRDLPLSPPSRAGGVSGNGPL